MTKQSIALLTFALLCHPALAEVYRCESGGKTVYSDAPCQGSGKKIDATPAAGHGIPQSELGSNHEIDRLNTLNRKNEAARSRRDLDREIELGERKISTLQEDMERDLEKLADKKRYARNNLAGAMWESSISTEMEATASRYRLLIQTETEKLSVLRSRRQALDAPAE